MRVPTYQDQQSAQVVRQPQARAVSFLPALQRAGVQVTELGSLLAQRQIIRDEADASNAFNAYAEESITIKNELEQLKGVEARAVSERYKDWHRDSVSRIKGKYLHNPESQTMFEKMADRHYLSKIGTLAKYQAGQEQEYNQSVLNRDLQNIEAEITDDPYATIETEAGEVPAIEDRIKAYHQKASILMGGAYTSDVAGNIESKMKASALSAMIVQDPSKVGPYLEKWKGDIGTKAYAQFKNTAQKEIIKKQVDAVYDTARTMDITDAEEYINKSGLPTNERRSLITDIRQDYDRKQKEIEEQQTKLIKQNDLDVLEAFYNKTLKRKDLDTLAEGQQVSKDVYKFINEKYDKEAEGENNPETLGRIAKMIEFKNYDQAEAELIEALSIGNVKGETYISMIRNIAQDQMSDATGYINRAIQPGEFEFDLEPKQRWAEALRDLNIRTRGGEDPMQVALNIIELNERVESQNLSGFRKPRYLRGKKDDPTALDEAVNGTVEAYYSKLIGEEEYKREIELIENIRSAIGRVEQIQGSKSELKDVLKGLKVGR